MDEKANQIIWEEARKYLNRKGISDEIIDLHLNLYQRASPNSINDVYHRLISTLVNRQGVPNWIGDIRNLERFFEGYSPSKLVKMYPDWECLIDAISYSDFKPPAAINKNDNRNIWVLFTKGVISGAKYLTAFQDHLEFDNFVNNHVSMNKHVQLARSISKKVHGYGFALACDFLKELGYSDFIKPDTHIIDIFDGLGLSLSRNVEEVFRSVLRFAESINEIPYKVDKMFWLIVSGSLYLLPKLPKISTDKFEYIEITRATLAEQGYSIRHIMPSKKTIKETKDNHNQADFRCLNEMLTELRRKGKINPAQYRDYAKRWREYPEFRSEIAQELSMMMK